MTRYTITDLLAIMRELRTPDTGCPWDLEQSFETIAPYTIEEAYEVADAITRRDMVELKEELGDLLLQVVYHSRLAEEQKDFAFEDVVDAISTKMVRRHPHVFGDAQARAAGAAKDWWETIKAQERAEREAERAARGDTSARPTSLLDDVPLPLPALTRALKLQDRAARVGFDWPNLGPVFDKLREEIDELAEVALPADPRGAREASGEPREADTIRIEEELGDLLFVVANVARHLALDPEVALRRANDKFVRRFRYIEHALRTRGKSPAQSDLAEMDALWDEAKEKEKAKKGGSDKG